MKVTYQEMARDARLAEYASSPFTLVLEYAAYILVQGNNKHIRKLRRIKRRAK